MRSQKKIRKEESAIMKALGLRPVSGSGNGWIHKQDGVSESILCQLKSTEKNWIRIHSYDLAKLEGEAAIEHKRPVFAIDIAGELYLVVRPEAAIIQALNEPMRYIDLG
ncbi:MAG: hypothetical protein FWG30_12095 [Eubacteriaceae bacterium]|nr:hypothetical protein [Eubacteriaceae bacterium]